jgi:hypothetical protein
VSLNTGLVRLRTLTVIQMSSGAPLELMLFTVTVFDVVVIVVLLLLNLTWAAPLLLSITHSYCDSFGGSAVKVMLVA